LEKKKKKKKKRLTFTLAPKIFLKNTILMFLRRKVDVRGDFPIHPLAYSAAEFLPDDPMNEISRVRNSKVKKRTSNFNTNQESMKKSK